MNFEKTLAFLSSPFIAPFYHFWRFLPSIAVILAIFIALAIFHRPQRRPRPRDFEASPIIPIPAKKPIKSR